jgi:hypothetical protein
MATVGYAGEPVDSLDPVMQQAIRAQAGAN